MIFVIVGTSQYQFNRLAHAVNDHANENPKERIVIQSGYTMTFKKASNISKKSFYTFDKMQDLIKTAHIVITHAGEGSVYLTLYLSKDPPIIVPRNPHFREHVDSQQLEIAEVVKKRKLAVVLTNPRRLSDAIKSYEMLSKNLVEYKQKKPEIGALINYLNNYVTRITK